MGVFKDQQGAECGWVKHGKEAGLESEGLGTPLEALGGWVDFGFYSE